MKLLSGWFCFAVTFSGLWASQLLAQPPVAELPVEKYFVDANRKLQLQTAGSFYLLQWSERTLQVQLGDRLLVKTQRKKAAVDISRFHPDIQQVQQLAQLQQVTWWLVTVTESQLITVMRQLQQQAEVIAVQPDLLQQRQHADMVGVTAVTVQPETAKLSKKDKPVRLAIIDDGFSMDLPALQNLTISLQYDADFRLADASPKEPQDQHGNQVAAVLLNTVRQYGVEPELVLIRQVSSWTSDMVLAFTVARMMQVDIVNSSWVLPFLPEPLQDVLTDWIQEQEPYLVFSAGNNQSDACGDNALSGVEGAWLIGADNGKGGHMAYSNYGPCVSLYAPAQFNNILTDKPFTGTSAATAYVSGLLARELAEGRKPDIPAMRKMLKTGLTSSSSRP